MMSFRTRLFPFLFSFSLFFTPGFSGAQEEEAAPPPDPGAEDETSSIMLEGGDIDDARTEDAARRATGSPRRITPSPYLDPDQVGPGEALTGPAEGDEDEAASLEGADLDPLDPGAIGLMSGYEAGFGPGLWQGSDPAELTRFVNELPGGTQSPTANRLMARLLLSSAPLPEGFTDDAAGGDFLLARLNALYRAGDMASLMEMFDQVRRDERHPGLTRLMTETYLLDGDFETACRLSNEGQRASGNAYFLKMNAVCLLLDGREAEARFTLSLLEEDGEIGFAFQSLFEDVAGLARREAVSDTPAETDNVSPSNSFFDRDFYLLSDLTPLHIGILKILDREVELSIDTEDTPNLVLAALARWQGLSLETKLKIADLAVKRGILRERFLKDLVGAYRFSDSDKENAYLLDYESWGVKSDALFYALALEAFDYPEAIQNVQEGWQRARVGGRGAFMADLFFEAIAEIPAEARFVSFAPDAVRISLLSGHNDKAYEWYSMVRGRAATGDAEATRMLVELWPWMITLDSAGEIPYSAQILNLWRRSLEVLAPEEQLSRALLFYEILGILGYEVPEEMKSEGMLAASGEIGVGHDIGGASLGETILKVLVALGKAGTVNASPFELGDALYTLTAAGLSDEGRHIVLEALLARGF